MIIDTRKYILKYNLKRIELSQKELKLLLLLSDNKYHTIKEIRKYVGIVFEINTKKLIERINNKLKYQWRISLISKQKDKNRYKITGNVYITY